jgi:putative cell wall-binding protein
MLAANSGLSPSRIRSILRSTAEDIASPGWDTVSGSGILRADRAVAAALAAEGSGDVTVVGGTAAVDAGVEAEIAALTGSSPTRLFGADRYATAAAISGASHPGGAATVYLTTGADFPDAIALGPVAARVRAPVLLVRRDSVPAATAAELARLSPSRVVVAGGPAAVSDAVVDQLRSFAAVVERVFGEDRYATSAAVSASHFSPADVAEVFLATGVTAPDALSAGAAAAVSPGPVLLTRPDSLPPAVRVELDRLDPSTVVIVGGATAVSTAVEEELRGLGHQVARVGGTDRYATSSLLSRRAFPAGVPILVATGEDFPDALTATASIGSRGGSLLLTRRSLLPAPIAAEIARLVG